MVLNTPPQSWKSVASLESPSVVGFSVLDTGHKIIGSAEPNELQVILICWWVLWSSELLIFSDFPDDPDMPGLEELLTPGPGRIEVVGACSLIVPEFSLADDLLPG